MKVRKFKKMLEGISDNAEIVFSQDEELNCVRKEGEVVKMKKNIYVIYGLDGTEMNY